MYTRLIISVLTEDVAERVAKEVLGGKGEVIENVFAGTYGIRIPFENWIWEQGEVYDFLYSEETRKILGANPSDLMYYEVGGKEREIDFKELYPSSGFWNLGGRFQISTSLGCIYWGNRKLIEIERVGTLSGMKVLQEPDMKEGLSKVYRRGFLSIFKKTEKIWETEFKDILEF